MLGEMLFAAKQPAQALTEFEAAMKKEPGRFRALLGAARAAEAAGDRGKSREYFERLAKQWDGADQDFAELGRVKQALLATSAAKQ